MDAMSALLSESEHSLGRLLKTMIDGYRLSQMIHVAAKLNIADLLAAGPMTIDELAGATEAHSESLRRVLRALASFGIFFEGSDGAFQLTPIATLLRHAVPGSQWAVAASIGEPWWWCPWGRLLHSAKTGQVAFDSMFGEGLFEFLRKNDQAATIFNEHMQAMTEQEAEGIVAAYDFSQSPLIADIGGGTGALLSTILRSHPHVRGVLFDDASVISEAQAHFGNLEIRQRCSFVPGSFFHSVPPGADLYLLKDILHDWDDPAALEILRNIRRTMPSHSSLVLVERLITPNNQPSAAKAIDIVMLVLTGGKQRTVEQYGDLLGLAGFKPQRVIDASLDITLIGAVPF
jgi:hypothetical protein